MKLFFTLICLLNLLPSFAQWTRVKQLPSSDIISFYSKNGKIYAGGKGVVYYSFDDGKIWDSTNRIPGNPFVDNIIVFKNELFVSGYSKGIFKSVDHGETWQNTTGIFPFISGFSEFQGNLYASTEGEGVFRLDAEHPDRWNSYSSGISNINVVVRTLASTSKVLIAGTNANGYYLQLPANSSTWEEKLLLNQLKPTEGTHSIVTAHDSLLLAGFSGAIYLSTDDGNNWNKIVNGPLVSFTALANAKQAFLTAANVANGVDYDAFFLYLKKDSLSKPRVVFSTVPNHFSYRIEIVGDELWDASSTGLFHMPLADLPGITSATDPVAVLSMYFVHFMAELQPDNSVKIVWKTSNEADVQDYTIERSLDRIQWKELARLGNTSAGEYSYLDPGADLNTRYYYRIKETDKRGNVVYSVITSIITNAKNNVFIFPNPVSDILHVQLPSANTDIRIVDAQGRTLYTSKMIFTQYDLSVLKFKPGQYFIIVDNKKVIQAIPFLKL